jgi:hypothetical protein
LRAFCGPIEDPRGPFHGRVVGRQAGDGTWEGTLEFAPANDPESLFVTGVECRQQTREQLLRWASELAPVYTEGALQRAHLAALPSGAPHAPSPDRPSTDQERKDLRKRLRELIAALDRRVPQFGREGEHRIVRDAAMLKRQARDRIAELE